MEYIGTVLVQPEEEEKGGSDSSPDLFDNDGAAEEHEEEEEDADTADKTAWIQFTPNPIDAKRITSTASIDRERVLRYTEPFFSAKAHSQPLKDFDSHFSAPSWKSAVPDPPAQVLLLTPVRPPPSRSQVAVELPTTTATAATTVNSSPSQIEGGTMPERTLVQLEELAQAHQNQHLTVLSVELHVNTRADFRPNPLLDPVSCICYTIVDDDARARASSTANRDLSGVLLVGKKETALPNVHTDCFPTEESLFQAFIQLVRKHDPDILVGFEVQMASLGYLIERANALSNERSPFFFFFFSFPQLTRPRAESAA
jgi:hypothetical protein